MERIFRQSAEFTVEHDVWKLNVAHAFYMQENKFKDAIEYYEPMVSKAQNQVCVCVCVWMCRPLGCLACCALGTLFPSLCGDFDR